MDRLVRPWRDAIGHIKQERISFRIARNDEVTVTVIDSGGTDVAELLRDHFVARYKQLSLRWNGRRGSAHGVAAQWDNSLLNLMWRI